MNFKRQRFKGRRQSISIFLNGIVPLRRGGGGGKGLKIRWEKWKSVGDYSE